ncbi:DUF3000 domain-containing protein [uncultured Micrococcus sp.]|uniref:DUF3000 domain-containing protein n=1 Tax=uncultured Micrococcus sp. TaxID=114051 RepID=UPI0025DE1574|nr:DUF3000 domain-containing protein [uncultured Micrococcus sp.]
MSTPGPLRAVGAPARPAPTAAFRDALADLRDARPRTEVRLRRIEAPRGLAPHAVALAAEVHDPAGGGEAALATGRFVLLHDPAGSPAWHGVFRAVTYIRASLEPEAAADHLAGAVAWTWLTEALDLRHAEHTHAGGTATRQLAEHFGVLAEEPGWTDLELRASWTPAPRDLGAHLEAWSDMICAFAGLPPEADAEPPPAARR